MIPKIVEYLDFLYPNPRCELNYQQDYELLLDDGESRVYKVQR